MAEENNPNEPNIVAGDFSLKNKLKKLFHGKKTKTYIHKESLDIKSDSLIKQSQMLKKIKIGLVVVIVVLGAGVGTYMYQRYVNNKKFQQSGKTMPVLEKGSDAQNRVENYKNANTDEQKYALVFAYVSDKKYDEAYKLADSLVKGNSKTANWLVLLNVCAPYPVTDKTRCMSDNKNYFQANSSKLDFKTAYSAGGFFEYVGDKQTAVVLYKIADSKYDSKLADGQTMTKDELEKHITELSQ